MSGHEEYEHFNQASRLGDKLEEYQMNTMVYIGDGADYIVHSLSLMGKEKENYKTAKKTFEDWFVKPHNPVVKKAKFNQRSQMEDDRQRFCRLARRCWTIVSSVLTYMMLLSLRSCNYKNAGFMQEVAQALQWVAVKTSKESLGVQDS